MKKRFKAVALFSGGLDSLISMKLISDQGIDVIALHIETGFGGRDAQAKLEYLYRAVGQVGAELKIVDIKEQFVKEILFDPKYGYGKNFNPCIDCHGNMFRVAARVMEEMGGDFLISGEVLGQRPMSQRAEALAQVVKLSQVDDLILRPMSAKLMAPTLPEREGWVDREKLLGISGRGRETQIAFAAEHGIKEYESPSGGCLLTDENFSNKIKDFIENDAFSVRDIEILKFGRHLRLPDGAKLVIGRNHEENLKLQEAIYEKYKKIEIGELKGPYSMINADASEADIELAIRLVLTYSRTTPEESYVIFHEDKEYNLKPFASKDEAKIYFLK